MWRIRVLILEFLISFPFSQHTGMRLTDVIIVESDVTFPYMYLEFPDWSHADHNVYCPKSSLTKEIDNKRPSLRIRLKLIVMCSCMCLMFLNFYIKLSLLRQG